MSCSCAPWAKVVLAVALLAGPVVATRAAVDAAPVTPAFGPAIDPFAPYQGQTTCDPTPKPGAVALAGLAERAYPATRSFGIVRACDIGGSSEHKEGRAFDWGVNAADPAQMAMATEFLTWALAADGYGNVAAMARRLGFMYVIWNRQIWKSYAAERGWQPYTGANAHTDHVHFSLSYAGGNARTSWHAPIKAPDPGRGYWLATGSGATIPFAAPGYGGLRSRPSSPVVGLAALSNGRGYWQVAGDGGIFTFGEAGFFGSTGSITLSKPIVGMASTPTGRGYWLVASDGGIFSYGDATFRGSTGKVALTRPIVAMAPTPSGAGYWLVASDGGVFAFGDASFEGSTGALRLNKPIVGMAADPGGGYWLVASDGGVFGFGGAAFLGSTGAVPLTSPIRAMAATVRGEGYWLVASDGGIFAFGDAPFQGSAAARSASVVGIARYR